MAAPYFDTLSSETERVWQREARRRLVRLLSDQHLMMGDRWIPPIVPLENAEKIVAAMSDDEVLKAMAPTHCPECGHALEGD